MERTPSSARDAPVPLQVNHPLVVDTFMRFLCLFPDTQTVTFQSLEEDALFHRACFNRPRLTRVRNSAPLAALLLFAPVLSLASPHLSGYADPQPSPVVKTSKDYDRLRTHAHTAQDYQALAEWCRTRASKFQQEQAARGSELDAYYRRQSNLNLPKYPPRDQTLKTLIARDREQATHWNHLATEYSEQARKIETSQ